MAGEAWSLERNVERGLVSGGSSYGIVETWKRNESPGNGLVDEEENEKIALVERKDAEVEGKGEGGVAAVALGGVWRDVEELGVDGDVGEHLDVGSEGNADVLDDGELDDARRTLQDRKPRSERVFFAVERLGALHVIAGFHSYFEMKRKRVQRVRSVRRFQNEVDRTRQTQFH